MKVLIANDCPLGLSGSGGVETHIRQLKEALKARGISVALLVAQRRGLPEQIEEDLFAIPNLNAPPLRKHVLSNYRQQRAALARAKELIQQYDPDVINIHNFVNPGVLHMLRKCGPVVKSLHDCRPFCIKPPPVGCSRLIGDTKAFCDMKFGLKCWTHCYAHAGHTPIERIEAWSYFPSNLMARNETIHCDHIVTYGSYLKELAGRLFPDPDRLHVVYHFTDAERESAGFEIRPQKEPVFLFAGRLSAEKAPQHIFDALDRIPEVSCRVIIAGDGALRDNVEARARNASPNHKIEIKGYVGQQELYDLYRQASVLLFTSIGSEGCPLVGLEAMYFGNTAIGYDTGGAGEWLVDGQTGVCVEIGDVDGLARAMARMIRYPDERLRLRRQAREYVQQKFRREQHIDHLIDVYEQTVRDRAG
ncbi:glycosyltransferase family 4 protein [Tichowtungia aerotolerans]|uniref:Glycosyltransferase n=1 Tax=Tichowtungia aerotolerans TaxID=2697043 RepID=A0A6P1M6S3_9BACT|nr:glycosyltransferase family 4 protein [Tichowtungia aerotolerans]QHI70280.1 glycosyltransferase [Tichowtungia aerotolerans]